MDDKLIRPTKPALSNWTRLLLLCSKNEKKEPEQSLFLSDKFGPFIVQLWVVASVPRFSTVNILQGAEVQ
jgi:hypothetical protein